MDRSPFRRSAGSRLLAVLVVAGLAGATTPTAGANEPDTQAAWPTATQLTVLAAKLDPNDMIQIGRDGSVTVVTVAEQRARAAHQQISLSPEGSAPDGSAQLVRPPVGSLKAGDPKSGFESGFESAVLAARSTRPGPAVIIGNANFTHVADTTTAPYRRIGLALMHDSLLDNCYVCTGWLYALKKIATAAHCFQELANGNVNHLEYFAAGYSEPYAPYGTCAPDHAFIPAGWWTYHSTQYDFAAVELLCTIGNTTGWFNLYNWSAFDTQGRYAKVTGYPYGWSGTLEMYYSYIPPDIKNDYSFYLRYKNDTAGGDSGAPVYRYATDTINGCTGYCVFGIHSGYIPDYCIPGDSSSGACNIGRKLTQGVYDFLVAAGY